MEWLQFTIFVLTFFGVFVWNRTESRNDIRHMDAKLESTRDLVRAIHDETKEIRAESKSMINAIHLEMKDFHYRLCSIEERNKDKK